MDGVGTTVLPSYLCTEFEQLGRLVRVLPNRRGILGIWHRLVGGEAQTAEWHKGNAFMRPGHGDSLDPNRDCRLVGDLNCIGVESASLLFPYATKRALINGRLLHYVHRGVFACFSSLLIPCHRRW